jgi:hypothetical protein
MGAVGQRHGCGRAMYGGDPKGVYGSPYELALLAYWTKGCIQSIFGFPDDGSLTCTFAGQAEAALSTRAAVTSQPGVVDPGFNLDLGIRMMQQLGIGSFMAYTPKVVTAADQQPSLERVARSGPWSIYQLATTALVAPLRRLPVVESTSGTLQWIQIAGGWFAASDQTARPASSGPSLEHRAGRARGCSPRWPSATCA